MSDIIFYQSPTGVVRVEVRFENDSFWLTQKAMAELFAVNKSAISKHLANIFETEELDPSATVSILETVQEEGTRNVTRNLEFYNLDAVIAVGYRVNSKQATQFRIWATQTLKEFITKGFVLDDERLKQGKQFGRDYFDELLARIRDIRASEKRFYQKIKDLFALSTDYQAQPPTQGRPSDTDLFFAQVQNKLLFATTQHTAAEIVARRANAEFPNMGLTTWKGSRVRKEDIYIAKNYLTPDEIDKLNRMVSLFLDAAEMCVEDQNDLSLAFWQTETDRIIEFSRKKVLIGAGSVSKEEAKTIADGHYSAFDQNRKRLEAQAHDAEDDRAVDVFIKQITTRKKQPS
jgi:hypothetical protein